MNVLGRMSKGRKVMNTIKEYKFEYLDWLLKEIFSKKGEGNGKV